MPPTIAPPATAAARTGRTVAAELARHDVTRTAAAAELGLTTEALRRRITGSKAFDVDELQTLALMLGIPLGSLLPDGADEVTA